MNEPNPNERIKSAATPKTAGAMEEREAIAAFVERVAREHGHFGLCGERDSLNDVARMIRDSKQHEGTRHRKE